MSVEMISTKHLLDIVSAHKIILELGCGRGNMLKNLWRLPGTRKLVGIDAWPKAIQEAKKATPRVDFRVGDVRKIDDIFEADAFECIFGMDIIEHLALDDAYNLLTACDKIASKCQAFFVPVGKHVQKRDTKGMGGNHHWDTHRSTWWPRMMVNRGFEVWHFDDWYSWPEGAPKDPNAMWCLKSNQSKAQVHECKRRG